MSTYSDQEVARIIRTNTLIEKWEKRQSIEHSELLEGFEWRIIEEIISDLKILQGSDS